jgi:hypothetical protein
MKYWFTAELSFINEDDVILNDTTFNVSEAPISLDGKGYDKRNWPRVTATMILL